MLNQITFDPKELTSGLDALAVEVGVSVSHIVYDQMRLWAIDVMRITPPGRTRWKRKGTKRVEADLNKLFVGVRSDVYKAYLERMESRGITRVKEGGTFRDLHQSQMLPKSAIKPVHKRYRRRDGRVKYRGPAGAAFGGKMLTQRAALNRYRRQKTSMVGMSKKGWVPAILHWARMSNAMGQTRIPSQIQKVKAPANGHPVGKLRKNGSGTIQSVNDNPWMGRKMGLSVFQLAEAKRSRDIHGHMKKRAENIAKRFNAGKI